MIRILPKSPGLPRRGELVKAIVPWRPKAYRVLHDENDTRYNWILTFLGFVASNYSLGWSYHILWTQIFFVKLHMHSNINRIFL
jgi:hypothetical protein